jgi:hypothetical protein
MSSDLYTLRQQQWIPRPISEAFAFFADAHNLQLITPPWLGFKILSRSTDSIAEGTEIIYRLRLHGIPIPWRTRILDWDPPYGFVDVQKSGPYRFWHHRHKFEAHGARTLMFDSVDYVLPFCRLGRIVHALKVRSDVQRIFDYRYQRIEELFGEQPGSPT